MRRLCFALLFLSQAVDAAPKDFIKDPMMSVAFATLRPRLGRFSLLVEEKESELFKKKRSLGLERIILGPTPQEIRQARDLIAKAKKLPEGEFKALMRYSKGFSFQKPKILAQVDPLQKDVFKKELFEQVFGRSQKKSEKTFLNVYLESKSLGLLPVMIKGNEVFFEAEHFMKRLKVQVKESYYQTLYGKIKSEKISQKGSISTDFLRAFGLETIFDRANMRLSVKVPASYRRLQRHSLSGLQEGITKKAKEPEDFSAYLNFHAEKTFVHSSADGHDSGGKPLNVGFFATSRWKDLVFEGHGVYREQRAAAFSRDDLRLLYHRPEKLLKFIFGDINHPSLGFQSSRKMLGFEITKDYELQPYLRKHPQTRRRIFLKHPSQVEIFVNGLRVQRMQLPAGEHEFSHFPLDIGANDVQIHIQDDYGREEQIAFPFILEAELLEQGLSQYSISLGHPQKETNERDRRYDGHHATLTGFYRQGLTKHLTAGTYLQAEQRQLLMGLEGLGALFFGSIEFDCAYSRLQHGMSGYAFRTAFRNYLSQLDIKPLRYAVQAQYLTRRFALLGQLEPANDSAVDLSFNSSQDLGYGVFGGLGLSYQFLRNAVKDPYTINLSFSKRWKSGLDSRLNVNQKRGSDRFIERSILISLAWAIPATSHSFRLNHSSLNDSVEFAWLNYPRKIQSFSHSVQYRRNDLEEQYLLQGLLSDHRGKCKALFEAKELRGLYMTRQSKWSIDSAIAYVDGNVAISRPISDSFAMIIPKASAKNLKIAANPSDEEYQAQSDFWGPGVLHQLGSYRKAKVFLESPDLPPGKDLGQSRYELLPSYRSGFAIYAGSEAAVILKGRLLGSDSMPLSLQLGKIFLKEDGEGKAQMFFSNREGKFVIPRLKGGLWVLRLLSMPGKEIEIEIPQDFDGVYKSGDLNFKSNS